MDNQLRPALCHRSPGFYTLLEDRPNVLDGVQVRGMRRLREALDSKLLTYSLRYLPSCCGLAPPSYHRAARLASQLKHHQPHLSLEDPDGVFDLIEGAAVGILWGIDGKEHLFEGGHSHSRLKEGE